MNICRRIHPPDYDPESNERFYETMASRGWLLEKRDGYWSTFRRGAPQDLHYRLEYCGGFDLPDGQRSLYAECGWTLAARYRNVFVFSSAADNPFPELYNAPAQQAGSVEGLDKTASGPFLSLGVVKLLIPLPILLALLLLVPRPPSDSINPSSLALFFGYFLLAAAILCQSLRFSLGFRGLYRRLSSNEAIRCEGVRWYRVWNVMLPCAFLLGILLIVLGIAGSLRGA